MWRRDAWKVHAAQQGGRGAYLRFANMLINDSIYLLDESLKYVKVGHRSMQLHAQRQQGFRPSVAALIKFACCCDHS